MASILLHSDRLEIKLTAAERVLARRKESVVIPRDSIRSVSLTDDPWIWVRGVRAPGTAVPLTLAVGQWKFHGGKDFLVLKGPRPAVVIDLVGEEFRRVLVSTSKGVELIAALRLEERKPHKVRVHRAQPRTKTVASVAVGDAGQKTSGRKAQQKKREAQKAAKDAAKSAPKAGESKGAGSKAAKSDAGKGATTTTPKAGSAKSEAKSKPTTSRAAKGESRKAAGSHSGTTNESTAANDSAAGKGGAASKGGTAQSNSRKSTGSNSKKSGSKSSSTKSTSASEADGADDRPSSEG